MPGAPELASDGRPLVQPGSARAWRKWLAANHATSGPVWLVYRKKSAGGRDLTYDEAVEEALCFGWIDSTVKKLDDERYRQFFSRRKPTSTWSGTNKERVQRLIEERRMTEAGLAMIEAAKANGMWTALDAIEALEIPSDLAAEFRSRPGAKANFEAFSTSSKKNILWWIASAKRPETRARRIAETARMAAEGRRANHPEDRS
jgi:uncharacterized protein YdeI (YjbR/CyaY-like superfamily)